MEDGAIAEMERLFAENESLRHILEEDRQRQEEAIAEVERKLSLMEGELKESSNIDRVGQAYSTPTLASPTTLKNPGNSLLPEKFSGEGQDDWLDWIELFDTYASLNCWSEREQIVFLATLLRGRARKAWLECPASSRDSMVAIRAWMKKVLVPGAIPEIKKAELHSIHRPADGNLQDFAFELRRTVRSAYPELTVQAVDILAKDFFINKIEDRSLRLKLRHQAQLSFNEIVSYAIEWETIEKTDRTRASVLSGLRVEKPEVPEVQSEVKEIKKDIQEIKEQLKKLTVSRKPGKKSTKKRENKEKKDHLNLGSVGMGGRLSTNLDEKDPVEKLYSPVNDVYVVGRVQDRLVQITLDTGAGVSLIDKDTLYQLCSNPIIQPTSAVHSSISGQTLHVMGTTSLGLRLNTTHVQHTFTVVEDLPYTVMLGSDFLERYRGVIDFGKRKFKFRHGAVPLCVRGQENVVHVKALETISLSPRNQRIIWAQTEQMLSPGTEGMVEGHRAWELSTGIVVARVLVQSQDSGKVPLRVMNPTNEPLKITKKSILGTFTEVTDPSDKIEDTTDKSNTPLMPDLPDYLSSTQHQELAGLLNRYTDIFSDGSTPLGRTNIVQHRIDTGTAQPIKLPARRLPHHKEAVVRGMLDDMLSQGIIKPSNSSWSSPIVLVSKSDGSLRFCVDYRKLNDVTVKDAYPLPRINEALERLSQAKWFTSLDLISGYWQVGLDPETADRSAFSTLGGHFQFEVLAFGLCNAPASFQRLMDCLLSGLQWYNCLVYLDDIVVFSSTFESHLKDLEQVFNRIRGAGLKFKSNKCQMARRELTYLGHVISEDGISTSPKKVETVRHWPVPTCVKDVQKFLGLASYYRRFVKDFSTIAHPLTELTHKDVPFSWSSECQTAFETLRDKLISSPILAYPDFSCPFILDTDASDYGMGGVLSQLRDGREVVIAYFSKTFSKHERNYSVTRKELLAVITSCEHFKHYLIGCKFKVRTDHGSLRWLTNFKEPQGQVARWIERLADFDFEIEHRPGRVHNNADALSRHPSFSPVPVAPQETEVKGQLVDNQKSEETTPAVDCHPCSPRLVHGAIQVIPGYDIPQLQREDPELGKLIGFLEQQVEQPAYGKLGIHTRSCKELWSQWASLKLQDGMLVRILTSGKFQIVLPAVLRSVLLQRLHDASPEGAHLGVKKTCSKVGQSFYWPFWKKFVQNWCDTCQVCARKKLPRRKDRAPLQLEKPGFPFSRVAMDILGPLPVTEASNRYILVVQDYFTKFVEAFAIPNQEVRTIATKLVDEVFCRYGIPEVIHSDQGSNFESALFSELCELMQITKTRTSPYHPESDGMVERFNRTLLSMLSGYVSDYGSEWDFHLPKVLMAYRSSVHHSTGLTPNFALFKSEISLPIEFVLGSPPDRKLPLHGYLRDTWLEHQEAFARVRVKLEEAGFSQKFQYDLVSKQQKFQVGDKVWVAFPKGVNRQSRKFAKPWQGPFEVRRKYNDVLYKVQPCPGGKRKGRQQNIHVNRMKRVIERDALEPVVPLVADLATSPEVAGLPPVLAPGTPGAVSTTPAPVAPWDDPRNQPPEVVYHPRTLERPVTRQLRERQDLESLGVWDTLPESTEASRTLSSSPGSASPGSSNSSLSLDQVTGSPMTWEEPEGRSASRGISPRVRFAESPTYIPHSDVRSCESSFQEEAVPSDSVADSYSETSPPHSVEVAPLRRSTRPVRPPRFLRDYVT